MALMQELAPEPADLSAETGELVPEPRQEPGLQAAAGGRKEDRSRGRQAGRGAGRSHARFSCARKRCY